MNEKEYEAFREMFLRQFARLSEQAGKYTRRMSNVDRESVMNCALTSAEEFAEHFNPEKVDLLTYWDDCLKTAVNGRKSWKLRFLDGWRKVKSARILGGF